MKELKIDMCEVKGMVFGLLVVQKRLWQDEFDFLRFCQNHIDQLSIVHLFRLKHLYDEYIY